ncbi:helix-turn-helix transcriptional regulator [Pseudoalteromonas luteoviolacea]|uniref:helix-turn-helix transcriptional regulator n=1 Tax=Pseudoalteromonas luteoviolacea TaxID=43657 RepID=UPI001B362696|nr:helix-turn-helix transcriptional regulator [Pseudoalteromonas luteoviolacea]MBQ4812729.1 helix-turn-helix transcriptional regulator [Pseudoalteromonas luteoviolacea]
MSEQPILFSLNIATLCITFFSTHQLILRAQRRQVYWPLALCLAAIGVVIAMPSVQQLLPQFQVFNLVVSLPALLLIAPCLWLYTKGLTSHTLWQLTRRDTKHFLPAAFGGLIALITLCLPSPYLHAILLTEEFSIVEQAPSHVRNLIYGLLIFTFLSVLGWVLQSAWYAYKIIVRLKVYRAQLQDVFASTEQKELRWLNWLLFIVGGVWMFTALNVVLDNLFSPIHYDARLYAVMVFIVIYSLALWGLRQKPGFAELYDSTPSVEPNPLELTSVIDIPNVGEQKYQRSALSTTQAAKIAAKIEQAMKEEHLYLDAALSLPKLAAHIHTSPNYISQTLNETLGVRFFDYVNKHRVTKAKEYLQTTDKTILEVAMTVGFNSKSAFYTAFKKHTDLTPSQYKAASG